MKFKFALLALLGLSLVSCVQTADINTPFNPALHDYALQNGKSAITGQGFMRRNDGIVVYAAGSPVYMLPLTAYTREIMQKAGAAYAQINFSNLDPRLKQYIKRTQANGEGRFIFSNVPDGEYMVVTSVNWMAGDMSQGGDLTQNVTISGGRNADIILTR